MANKKVRVGILLKNKKTFTNNGKSVEREMLSIALGTQGRDPKYNTTVELIVKDNTGKVIHTQTNGFINLTNPRTQPGELLQAGIISEEIYNKMLESAGMLNDSVRFTLDLNLKG